MANRAGGEGLAQAMQMLANLPRNSLMQFPSGKWGFVGKVDAHLMYVTKEGTTPTEAQFRAAAQMGPGIVGLKTRTWHTEEEAITDASRAI